MALFSRATESISPQIAQARDFCRANRITVMACGPNALTVEARSSECAAEICSQLASFGLKPMPNEDDKCAGMLDLAPDPDAMRSQFAARIAAFDISRPP